MSLDIGFLIVRMGDTFLQPVIGKFVSRIPFSSF
jgi:hypothetical protein